MPLNLYEGLHDRVLSLPDEPCSSDLLTDSDATEVNNSSLVSFNARNEPQDLVRYGADQNFLRSVLKFADRAKKMPKSKLTSCFHSFGAAGVCHTRLTATSIVKKAKRGKIHVQPESVKRRKVADGTRRRQAQGQTLKNNPFKPVAGKAKRVHMFAEYVRRNEPVAKKAGRSMATKTRVYEKYCS